MAAGGSCVPAGSATDGPGGGGCDRDMTLLIRWDGPAARGHAGAAGRTPIRRYVPALRRQGPLQRRPRYRRYAAVRVVMAAQQHMSFTLGRAAAQLMGAVGRVRPGRSGGRRRTGRVPGSCPPPRRAGSRSGSRTYSRRARLAVASGEPATTVSTSATAQGAGRRGHWVEVRQGAPSLSRSRAARAGRFGTGDRPLAHVRPRPGPVSMPRRECTLCGFLCTRRSTHRGSRAWLWNSHSPRPFTNSVRPPSVQRLTWSMCRIGASQYGSVHRLPSRARMNVSSTPSNTRRRESPPMTMPSRVISRRNVFFRRWWRAVPGRSARGWGRGRRSARGPGRRGRAASRRA